MDKRSLLAAGSLALLTALNSAAQVNPQSMAVPAESTIPEGPKGAAIRAGKLLLTETHLRLPKNVGNKLNCTSCHLAGGTTANASPWVGIWGAFPEYRARSGKVISLQERVNDCFERSMNGKALPYDSLEMNNILSYMQWLSSGVPTGTSPKGRGFGPVDQKLTPNAGHGKEIYAAKCASCHGATGAGVKNPDGSYVFPAVWGNASFNDGAGMARTYTAAAFVKYNMPLGQGGSLSDQEAIDVAEFFTHQPRPVYAKKAKDWPKGGKPKDARN